MPLFLLGAGFNADAAGEAGPLHGNSIYVGRYVLDCSYPLVAATARLCFGLDEPPADRSIEEMFRDALERRDYGPLEKLSNRLMEADYRLAWRLSSPGETNCYQRFFETFAGSSFITFNYDSLPEIFLHRAQHWYPHDGYGLPVGAERFARVPDVADDRKSTSLVLHLHGSFCVYTIEHEITQGAPGEISWLRPLETPRYGFDPDSISHCFPLYTRVMSRTGYVGIEERVIAPVPDKAQQLLEPFVRSTYGKACSLIRESGSLVAVGYSFNRHDGASYGRILQALSDSSKELVIVSPQATIAAQAIALEYPPLRVTPIDKTFKEWCQDSFRY